MTATKVLPAHWEMIVERIYKGTCVPFLGAGVNVGCPGYQGLPLGGEVALRLVEIMIELKQGRSVDLSQAIKLENSKQYREQIQAAIQKLATKITPEAPQNDLTYLQAILPDDHGDQLAHVITHQKLEEYRDLTRVALQDLARVALRYRSQVDLPKFIEKLQSIIPDWERKPSGLLRTLATLPFKLIVTTNYDRLMERALELFQVAALKNADSVAVKLKTETTLLSQFLREGLSTEMQQLLDEYDRSHPAFCFWPPAMVEEFNDLLQNQSLYELKERVGPLTDDLRDLLAQKPLTIHSVRQNRLLLEAAFADEILPLNNPYEVIVQPIGGFQGKEQNILRDKLAVYKGLIVYKLHGTFPDEKVDDVSRPVITEEDYIEFLTFIGGKGEMIDNQIKETITNSTLLFLGYSLEDWNFRALFKGLIEKLMPSELRMSFAIQKDPSGFWVDFWRKKSVIIYNIDLYEFAQELGERYQAYAKQAEPAKQQDLERRRLRRGRP